MLGLEAFSFWFSTILYLFIYLYTFTMEQSEKFFGVEYMRARSGPPFRRADNLSLTLTLVYEGVCRVYGARTLQNDGHSE